jgi:energy-coupling factor transporter ATP-binding protein EcfA2
VWEPCAKSDFRDWVWINWLLYSRVPRAQAEQMHIEDIWATWFAVPHYQNEYPPKLHLYPRMQHLVNMKRSNVARQFPSLIAFFGETGSGKSTLIRALIRNISPNTKAYPVPVPGDDSALDRIKSTSGDVHLYADPESLSTEVPLFYAGVYILCNSLFHALNTALPDCEGFRGTGLSVASRLVSEAAKPRSSSQRNTLQKPVSLSVRSTRTPNSSRNRLASQGTTSSRQRVAGQDGIAARHRFISAVAAHSTSQKRTFELRWAQLRQPGTHGPAMGLTAAESTELSHVASESRGLIVNELYPRLLYAFSDVVCFITNNPRSVFALSSALFSGY